MKFMYKSFEVKNEIKINKDKTHILLYVHFGSEQKRKEKKKEHNTCTKVRVFQGGEQ